MDPVNRILGNKNNMDNILDYYQKRARRIAGKKFYFVIEGGDQGIILAQDKKTFLHHLWRYGHDRPENIVGNVHTFGDTQVAFGSSLNEARHNLHEYYYLNN